MSLSDHIVNSKILGQPVWDASMSAMVTPAGNIVPMNGVQGVQGATGPQGPLGATGATGAVGATGPVATLVGTANYISCNRLTNQTIAYPNTWANYPDINFDSVTGNLSQNTSGVHFYITLKANTTYHILAGLSLACGGQYGIQFGMYNLSGNVLIGKLVEMVQATNSTYNISSSTMDQIYTPAVDTNVYLKFGPSIGMASGEYVRGDLQTFWNILQVNSLIAGPTGASGAAGAVGVQGPTGNTGATGPSGMVGLTGPSGGPTGAQGPQGIQGVAGPASVGSTGATGPQGATGATGAAATTALAQYATCTKTIAQTISSGNWANQYVIFESLVGNLSMATTSGESYVSLLANTTYRISAGLSFSGGTSVGTIAFGLFVFAGGAQIGSSVEVTQGPQSSYNTGSNTLEQYYTPTIGTTVCIKMTSQATIDYTTQIRGNLQSYFNVEQISSSVAGPQGSTGNAGATGPAGSTGSVGAQGAAGVQGIAGSIGATGAAGLTGTTGLTGAIGATGPASVLLGSAQLTLTGVPTIGQTPVATSNTTATWQTTPGIIPTGIPVSGMTAVSTSSTTAVWQTSQIGKTVGETLITSFPTNTSTVIQALATLAPSEVGGTYLVGFSSEYYAQPANEITQNAIDFDSAITFLSNYPTISHTLNFGSGEIITPGGYQATGAATTTGNLVFDGGGNANAIFVIVCSAALAVGVSTTCTLQNNAKACNIFWYVHDAVTFGASAQFVGTVFSYSGTISTGNIASINGRLMARNGAIATTNVSIERPDGIPGIALNSLANMVLFTNSGAIGNTGTYVSIGSGDIATGAGAITGYAGIIGNQYVSSSFNARTTFSVWANNVLVANSSRTKEHQTTVQYQQVNLNCITPVLPASSLIEVRVKTDVGSFTLGARSLTITKVM